MQHASLDLQSAGVFNLESAEHALDELFVDAGKYRLSADYLALMQFICHFHTYAPFNAMLVNVRLANAVKAGSSASR